MSTVLISIRGALSMRNNRYAAATIPEDFTRCVAVPFPLPPELLLLPLFAPLPRLLSFDSLVSSDGGFSVIHDHAAATVVDRTDAAASPVFLFDADFASPSYFLFKKSDFKYCVSCLRCFFFSVCSIYLMMRSCSSYTKRQIGRGVSF